MIRYATIEDLDWITYVFNSNKVWTSYDEIKTSIESRQALVDDDTRTALLYMDRDSYVYINAVASEEKGFGGALKVASYLIIMCGKPIRFAVEIGSDWENYILNDEYARKRHTLVGTKDIYHIYEAIDERWVR